jgi:hypothetical protein
MVTMTSHEDFTILLLEFPRLCGLSAFHCGHRNILSLEFAANIDQYA